MPRLLVALGAVSAFRSTMGRSEVVRQCMHTGEGQDCGDLELKMANDKRKGPLWMLDQLHACSEPGEEVHQVMPDLASTRRHLMKAHQKGMRHFQDELCLLP